MQLISLTVKNDAVLLEIYFNIFLLSSSDELDKSQYRIGIIGLNTLSAIIEKSISF